MRRADRLFQIVQIIRSRRITTAAYLAEHLEVSLRTIYRCVNDLVCSGVPIEGEAGKGYRIHASYNLPPLMFNEEEAAALLLGARLVESCGDEKLAQAARQVMDKVNQVVPHTVKQHLRNQRLFAPWSLVQEHVPDLLAQLRPALEQQRKLSMHYVNEAGVASERIVRPLTLAFWGKVWTLAAWCEMRQSLRTFRVDRIQHLSVLKERFVEEPGKALNDYFAQQGMRNHSKF